MLPSEPVSPVASPPTQTPKLILFWRALMLVCRENKLSTAIVAHLFATIAISIAIHPLHNPDNSEVLFITTIAAVYLGTFLLIAVFGVIFVFLVLFKEEFLNALKRVS